MAMSVEFEWRLQDEPLPDPSGPPVRRRGWRRPLVWAAAALVLVLAVLCAWWRISRNVSAQGEGQVEAVVRLEIEASASGDRELYLSLQDPVLRAWYDTYETPAAQGQFLPPVLPGLAATAGISVESVRVVGDLARVELLRSIESPDALPVTFRATRFYLRDASGRWLHARLDRDYAGHVMVWVKKR